MLKGLVTLNDMTVTNMVVKDSLFQVNSGLYTSGGVIIDSKCIVNVNWTLIIYPR